MMRFEIGFMAIIVLSFTYIHVLWTFSMNFLQLILGLLGDIKPRTVVVLSPVVTTFTWILFLDCGTSKALSPEDVMARERDPEVR